MNGYKTLKEGVYRLEIKKSEFIAYAFSVKDAQDAAEKLAQVKKKHYDARHVCYAYIADADGMVVRFSDDGEPSGTAGKPILDVIVKNSLKKSLIAVVRYFGGILLGAGGLTRAYSDSAAGVVASMGSVFMEEREVYLVRADYSTFRKISAPLKNLGEQIAVEYSDAVSAKFSCEKGVPFGNAVTDVSGGRATATLVGSEFFPKENQ